MPGLEPILAAAVLTAIALALLVAGLAGFRLAKHRATPQRKALQTISELTPENLRQRAPETDDKLARAALVRLWALTEPVVARQRQLLEQNGELQRRYGQARALIDLMAEFNEVMQLAAVLDRLSTGLSRFFAGDGVAIWIAQPDFPMVRTTLMIRRISMTGQDNLRPQFCRPHNGGVKVAARVPGDGKLKVIESLELAEVKTKAAKAN